MMGFWVTVASAEPYANKLHFAADGRPCQHLGHCFYRLDAVRDAQPIVSKH